MPSLSSPEAIDDLLLYRLARLFNVAGGMVTRLCEGRFRITRREWRVVAQLAREPGLLSSELAERAQLDRARTSRAVTSLVGKKLVLREVGRGDRRQVRLELSAKGRELYAALFPLVVDINAQLLKVLGSGEVAALDRALAALQGNADDIAAHAQLPKAPRRLGARRPADAG